MRSTQNVARDGGEGRLFNAVSHDGVPEEARCTPTDGKNVIASEEA